MLTEQQHKLISKMGAHQSWANTHRTERRAPPRLERPSSLASSARSTRTGASRLPSARAVPSTLARRTSRSWLRLGPRPPQDRGRRVTIRHGPPTQERRPTRGTNPGDAANYLHTATDLDDGRAQGTTDPRQEPDGALFEAQVLARYGGGAMPRPRLRVVTAATSRSDERYRIAIEALPQMRRMKPEDVVLVAEVLGMILPWEPDLWGGGR